MIELASVREPSGTIDSFLGLCAGRTTPALTIEDMNKIAAAGWAGELDSSVKSQRFASVWDAIEDDPAEAEKMKQWSALRRKGH
ncbi:MAG TPA: hypothetical protein PLZ11_08180 [Thauera sp.]|nr:hypothetical protein [Thauera sp.]HRK69217.1 hypothetical protein [Hyphomonas sp.]